MYNSMIYSEILTFFFQTRCKCMGKITRYKMALYLKLFKSVLVCVCIYFYFILPWNMLHFQTKLRVSSVTSKTPF